MDLLKTPSVQSLLDSDLESVGSLHYLEIEELDEIEYALPSSEAPTLEEILSIDDEENNIVNEFKKAQELPATCSVLQVEFLQAVSQQIKQGQERASAGAATALGVGTDGKITIGTAHGHLMSFYDQTLRWVCNSHSEGGAVSCISYNKGGTRILVGYARGHICQYESVKGIILRRVTLGGEIWGILRVTWAGTSGLALDTGGSVWLIKFARPLGVRSARTSCLFSGARGEVVAMTARDARVLALATLSRVIIVAGGRAAGLRLSGPPDTLPVLEWSERDEEVLVCARANLLQWLTLSITGDSISLRPLQRVELKYTPLWLGWLGGNLALFDVNENLRLWGEDYDKPLEISHIEPVYASAFYKGHWTDGRVSQAMCTAGGSALAGACVIDGTLCILGRRGVVRVRPRDILTRVQALFNSGRYSQALRLLSATNGTDTKTLAEKLVLNISERPHILSNKNVADQVIKLCLKYELREELWTQLWEQCASESAFVEAVGEAAIRGELNEMPPSPDSTQALIERLAEIEPSLVERVVASLPLTALDPHRATVFTRERGLWRGVGAIAAAIGGWGGAMRALCPHVSACGARRGACTCAGAALLLAAADALAGRAPGGRPLPDHRRPSARHDALHALLAEEGSCGSQSPLRVLVAHSAAAAARLLEQCARDPPFAGPLAKQNRLRVARHLLLFAGDLPEAEDRVEILEFLTGQINSGALPSDRDVIEDLFELAAGAAVDERGDRAWLALLARLRDHRERLEAQRARAVTRPRVLWRIELMLDRLEPALECFFAVVEPSETDIDELFEYLRARILTGEDACRTIAKCLPALIDLRPKAAAALVGEHLADEAVAALALHSSERVLEFGESLREAGLLRGDAAAAHLRNLCRWRPTDVRRFLLDEAGAVRPEEALAAVREAGAADAEPLCLEAVGDAAGALEALLRLVTAAANDAEAARRTLEAGELCARVAPTVPPAAAAAMWSRLVRGARGAPPSLLVQALAYLPAAEARELACRSAEAARAMLASAAGGRAAWLQCARVGAREAHEALARALARAQRGVAVRGRCARCGRRLAERVAARTEHCARASHADCEPEPSCATCGRRAPVALVSLAPRVPDAPAPPPQFALIVAAPPRPDLEGVV